MESTAGALALVGSGEYLAESLVLENSLVESGRCGRGESARYYVQIPTASGHESVERRAYWRNLGASAASRIGIEAKYLDLQDRSDVLAADAQMLEDIENAALIYFSGGDPYLLTEAFAGTPLWSAIMSAFARGASLAGCSAGAMAFCSHLVEFRSMGRRSRSGLGLIDNLQVIPHFDRMHIASRIPALSGKQWWEVPTLGIDEKTAVIWERGAWRVWGRSAAYLFGDPQEERVVAHAGQVLPLPDPVGSHGG
ncbi:MAG: Type 1 glutamine amidotransferase-like domain-containing protein [Actinomycetes bacterium]